MALCQAPLAGIVLVIAVLSPVLRPELLSRELFLLGLGLQAVLMLCCFAVPWERLRPAAVLAVPLLDFAAIGILRSGADGILPGLGVLAVFPVIWLAASGLWPRTSVLLSFLGPLLIVLAPRLAQLPAVTAADFTGTLLLPMMLLTVALAIRFATAHLTRQQRQLMEKDAALRALLDSANTRERLLHSILETIDVGLVVVDCDGREVLANRQQHLFRRLATPAGSVATPAGSAASAGPAASSDESQLLIFGRDRRTPVPPQERPVHRASQGESFSGELVWLGEGAGQRAVSVTARAVKDGDGSVTGAVLIFTDVTELVDAIQTKADLVSSVSHEFRTPLTSLAGYLDLVLDDEEDLPVHAVGYLDIARRNAERLLALVSDLLVSAPGSGSMQVQLRPTDLAGLVEASVGSARNQAQKSGICFVEEVPPSVWAYADPVRMGQVLDNLISNAIKYSPGGGTVAVRVREDDDHVQLQVADTGMGMTDAEVDQVFTKFYRTEAARNSPITGAGLGLHITRTIVENHGGSIACDSTPGAGTTFTVTLPISPSAAEQS